MVINSSDGKSSVMKINGSRVVRTQPGRGTGDVVYVTECGERWRNLTPFDGEESTGETRSYLTYENRDR